MNSEQNNLEKNISRLVKLAGDAEQPSKEYVDSLVDKSLDELNRQKAAQTREQRDTIMTTKKLFAYAAAIAVISGILVAVLMQRNQGPQVKSVAQEPISIVDKIVLEEKGKIAKSEEESAAEFTDAPAPSAAPAEGFGIKMVAKDTDALSRSKIEYTEKNAMSFAEAKPEGPKPAPMLNDRVGISRREMLALAPSRGGAVLAGAMQDANAPAGLVPLQMALPKPMFAGTPQTFGDVKNLEKPRSGPRPVLYVPEGTTNVALGKTVTGSDDAPIIGTLEMITDGDKEASDGSYVELGPMLQHVTIDLGAAYDIYAVAVWHYHKQARIYFDVVVQVADDPDFTANVRTIFNNDDDNSAGLGVGQDLNYIETCEGKLIDAKCAPGRFVRLYSRGNSSNDLNNYIEVEVYGKAVTENEQSKKAQSRLEPLGIKLPKPLFVGTPIGFGVADGFDASSSRLCGVVSRDMAEGITAGGDKRRGLVYCRPQQPSYYGMAHGGTTPPNGEDVDAMFFKNYGVNPFIDTEDDHLSTFATDVDTGSYTVVRGYLNDGHLPPNDAVRVEEFVNYFKYDYPAPEEDDFAVYAEAAPWQFDSARKNSHLLRIGLKAREVSKADRKPAVLTFVIDVSGSMSRENRLGLVKRALGMLVEQLEPEDRVGIAVYGSNGRKVLGHKGLCEKDEILCAIESLYPSGCTYAEEGIRIGYEMAQKAYRKGCINRVILCSDGVANAGQTGADAILEVIKDKAEKGIMLSAIGFGMGNYNDVLMERLADKGNGNYAYVDTIAEAKRVFVRNLTGTLQVVAKDVKVQVDFNPQVVRSYRLIGYENRDVPDDKFRDNKYDGGEVGGSQSVTALYELKLWPDKRGKVATTYVRYKEPETNAATEFKSSITTGEIKDSFEDTSRSFKLAAAAAQFAEILRKSCWAKDTTLDAVLESTQGLISPYKENSDIIELRDLVSKAERIMKDVAAADDGEDEDSTTEG